MKFFRILNTAVALSALLAAPVLAQMPQRHSQQQRPSQRPAPTPRPQDDRGGLGRGGQGQNRDQHYYNGRWVDSTEWQRHGGERDRWASRNRQQNGSDSSALVSGIIGFALGAAIVGSQQQAQQARSAGDRWDKRCADKYRSYDRKSRTYLGYDGARHYCA